MTNSYVTLDKKSFKRLVKQRLYFDWANILTLNLDDEDLFKELYDKLYVKNINNFINPKNITVSSEEALERYYKLLKSLSEHEVIYEDYLKIIEMYKSKTYIDVDNIIIDLNLFDFLKSSSLLLENQLI